jgi:hypothetical protein
MRLALAAAAVIAVAASRGGCGPASKAGYDPCAGKACDETCELCPPDEPGCVETAELKVCDGVGRCVPWSLAVVCDPCAGKACGNACVVEAPCRLATPPCMVPDLLGQCDASGACIPAGALTCPPTDSCVDRGCGVPCLAMDGMAPMACDGAGSCAPAAMLTCPP